MPQISNLGPSFDFMLKKTETFYDFQNLLFKIS